MTNDHDPRSDLGAWLGEELRNVRLAAGFATQDALARDLGFERTTINKAETGAAPPSHDVAARLAERLPGLAGGKFIELWRTFVASVRNGELDLDESVR
ncbi:MAG TPA: helix-turn-helix transcriptional regulator [Streptosporangiaceae bacterium]